jgi:hypothetical protein
MILRITATSATFSRLPRASSRSENCLSSRPSVLGTVRTMPTIRSAAGGSPRMCIGDRFSLMEQTLALAMTAQRFRVLIDHEPVPDPLCSLRPPGAICARLDRGTVRETANDGKVY